ncbi:uncharacterized protein [Maniola hyperantus]|uniref:uncharacterized protein n=1 Tax=Aphantopus hyperantus TaxID=2795564 RepID=UPI003747CFFE
MLPRVLLTAMAALAGVGAMETRETVQRLVMVRTSGSDLQPAATGYLYKKDDDGPESVVHMAESEVMEHLAKLYTRPTHAAHAAHGKPGANERVIPVKETHEEHVDGIADVDYKKIFDDYGHRRSYDDDLDNLKRFKGGLYRKYDADSAEDDKGSKRHKHGKDDAKSYHNEKFESYSISGDHKKDQDDGDAHDARNKHYDHYRGSNKDGRDAGHGKDGARSFHSGYDNDKGEHDYFGEGGKAFADGHQYYGTGDADGTHKHHNYEYEPKHYAARVEHDEGQGKEAAERADRRSSDESTTSAETPADVGSEGGRAGGSSFGYQVEH